MCQRPAVLLLAGLLLASAAHAQVAVSRADLSEANEVPPTGSAATGTCTGEFDPSTLDLVLTCTHDVASPTGAHVHNAATGVNGPIICALPTTNSFTHTCALSAAEALELDARRLYVNVHSGTFPGGEIRGQIMLEFVLNTSQGVTEREPAVAALGDGGFVVVWSGGNYPPDVMGQRFTSDLLRQGSEFMVNTYVSSFQYRPAVGADGSGGFVVAWASQSQSPDYGLGVFAQRFAAGGVPAGAEFHVNTWTTNHQRFPRVGMNRTGDFIVTWASDGQVASRAPYAQRFDSAGNPRGAEFALSEENAGSDPGVALDNDGDAVLAWAGSGANRIRRQTADGTLVPSEVAGYGSFAAVGRAPDGRFVVAYRGGSPSYEAVAQRYDADGSPLGTPFTLDSGGGYNRPLTVAMDQSGDFVVVWETGVYPDNDVKAAAFQADGTAVGSSFAVNTYTTGRQARPSAALDSDGQLLIAWEGPTDLDSTGSGISGRLYSFPSLADSLLSLDDVTVTEGDTSTTSAVFTATLDRAAATAATVSWETAAGTADGSDYSATLGTLSFAPGETVQTFSIDVFGDTEGELDESFSIHLSAVDGLGLTRNQATVTILNDESPALSINNRTVTEGDTGALNAPFTVQLFPPSGDTVTVDYATADQTATAGLDYTAKTGQLVFAPGQTSRFVNISVLGDPGDELKETFAVDLSGVTGTAILTDSQGVGTINDNDPTPASPTLTITNRTVTEGDSGTVGAIFSVRLSAPSGDTVFVDYTTADGTAIAGADYTAKSGRLAFAPGQTTKAFNVFVLGDLGDELGESFVVDLIGAAGATLADSQGVGTINDNDPTPASPTLTITNRTVTEGDSGTVGALFSVRLSAPSGDTVFVDYTTADGTATAGTDYTAKSGRLAFTPGQTAKAFSVLVLGDLGDELGETFAVDLTGAAGATLLDSQGLGTITDNDPTPASPTVTITNRTVTEGDSGTVGATFSVRLSASSGDTVYVDYATADGTATAGADYTSKSGRLAFAPGQTTKAFNVFVLGDLADEPGETFAVDLIGVAGATLADSQGVGTINDNDP